MSRFICVFRHVCFCVDREMCVFLKLKSVPIVFPTFVLSRTERAGIICLEHSPKIEEERKKFLK